MRTSSVHFCLRSELEKAYVESVKSYIKKKLNIPVYAGILSYPYTQMGPYILTWVRSPQILTQLFFFKQRSQMSPQILTRVFFFTQVLK